MKSASKNAQVEITNISKHGIWLFVRGQEFFLDHEHFPWFKDRPISEILKVEEPSKNHFYWPDLDVDLSLEIILNPDALLLISK